MGKQKNRESFANSTCRDTGHDWMTTLDATWWVCKRERCRASQRLVDGKWVSNAKLYRFHDPVVAYGRRAKQPRQTAMWEASQARNEEEYLR